MCRILITLYTYLRHILSISLTLVGIGQVQSLDQSQILLQEQANEKLPVKTYQNQQVNNLVSNTKNTQENNMSDQIMPNTKGLPKAVESTKSSYNY
jgi:hypothetical protein